MRESVGKIDTALKDKTDGDMNKIKKALSCEFDEMKQKDAVYQCDLQNEVKDLGTKVSGLEKAVREFGTTVSGLKEAVASWGSGDTPPVTASPTAAQLLAQALQGATAVSAPNPPAAPAAVAAPQQPVVNANADVAALLAALR